MRVTKLNLLYFSLVLFLLLILVADELNLIIRYTKYLAPFLFFFILVRIGKINKPNHQLVKLLSVVSIVILINFSSAIIYDLNWLQFFKEALFILSPLLLVVLLTAFGRPSDRVTTWIMLLPIIAYLITHLFQIIIFIGDTPNLFNLFVTSSIDTESQLSFAIGFSFIFFLSKKRRTLAIISFLFVLISFKRIVIGSCILVALISIFVPSSLIERRINLFRFIQIAGIFLFFVIFYLLFSGHWDQYFHNHGISLNSLTQGRYNGYKIILDHFGLFRVIGSGLGSTFSFLQMIEYPMLNLHNDHLKYLIEFGLVVYIFWLIAIIRLGIFNKASLLSTTFFLMVLMTDNISIYFVPLFFYYFSQFLNYDENDPGYYKF